MERDSLMDRDRHRATKLVTLEEKELHLNVSVFLNKKVCKQRIEFLSVTEEQMSGWKPQKFTSVFIQKSVLIKNKKKNWSAQCSSVVNQFNHFSSRENESCLIRFFEWTTAKGDKTSVLIELHV